MKNKLMLSISILSLSLMSGCATTNATPPLSTHSKIIDLPNMSNDDIYENSRQWFAESFTDSNDVLKYQDKSTSSIIGKGSVNFPCDYISLTCSSTPKRNLVFTVKVQAKDEKARIEFKDMSLEYPVQFSGLAGKTVGQTILPLTGEKDKPGAKIILDKVILDFTEGVKNSHKSLSDSW